MLELKEFSFLKPSPRYRELTLLASIRKNPEISQMELARTAGIRPSMVNVYLSEFETEGLIEKRGPSKRRMTYHLTAKGEKRLQVHLLSLLGEASQLFLKAKEIFRPALDSLNKLGASRLLLYGAGDVGSTICRVLLEEGFNIVGFVDDDERKVGRSLLGVEVFSWGEAGSLDFDACMVTSYRNSEEMRTRAERRLGDVKVLSLVVSQDGRVNVR